MASSTGAAATYGKRLRAFYVRNLAADLPGGVALICRLGSAPVRARARDAIFVVLAHPDAAYAIASAELIDQVHHHQLWTHIPPDARVAEGGAIMTNNIYVVDAGVRVRCLFRPTGDVR